MADPAAAAVGPLTVRAVPLRRDDGSFWMRQFVIERANGTVQPEELRQARGEIQDLLGLQLYFTIKVKFQMERFVQAPDPFGDGTVAPEIVNEPYLLKPAPWVVAPDADVDRRLNSIIEAARDKLAEHLERARLNGSRENIGGILRMYVLTSPGTEMARLPPGPAVGDEAVGTHHTLPPLLARKKCFWNPQTQDHSCFAWCVRAALMEVGSMSASERKNLARLTDKKLFMEGYAPLQGKAKKNQRLVPCNFGYDFSTLPPPSRGVTELDIQNFEEANGYQLRFFIWVWRSVEWEGRTYYEKHLVRQPRFQDFPARKEINLLRHENHYCLIWNFTSFNSGRGAEMDGSRQNAHNTMRVCHRCRVNFSNARTLARHQERPCNIDPSKRMSTVRMPRPYDPEAENRRSREDIIKYKPGPAEEFAPLTVYMDLEIECQGPPSEQVAEHTQSIQRHVLSGALLAVGRNGYEPHTRSYLTVREAGEGKFAAVERLLTELRRESERYLIWKRRVNIPARLTPAEQQLFDEAARCSNCGVRFVQDNPYSMKVCHHRHGTGEFINAICKRCNSLIVQPRLVRVLMHNGGNFDWKFLIRAISSMRRRSWEEDAAARASFGTVSMDVNDEEPSFKMNTFPDNQFDEEEEVMQQPDEEEESDEGDELGDDVEAAMLGKKWYQLPFSVLYKSGEKLLSFRLGCLQFVDSMNFYKTSLSNLMDELRKVSPDDPSKVFVQMAQLHPELQPAALTTQRRENLHRHFAPDRDIESITEEEFKQWTWNLLLRKLPMPFEKMQGPDVWTKPAVWEVEDYHSSLNPESPGKLAKKVKELQDTCDILGFTNFRQVHNCYLFMDLSLSDVMEHFRSSFHARFGQDPLQKISLPGAAFDAMVRGCLRFRHVELVNDHQVYDYLRDGMMGGLACIFNPRRRANSPELGAHFDPSQPTSYITSMDVSSMYPSVMCEGMPVNSGRLLTLPTNHSERMKWLSETLDGIDYNEHEETQSFAFVVDYTFPLHLHDQLDWAPPCRMRVGRDQLSPYTQEILQRNNLQCSQAEKLVPFLGAHKKEIVDGKRLSYMCREMGAKVERLHAAMVFRCETFLKPWLQKCYRTRLMLKEQGFGHEAELLKLVMNAMYGKLIQRCEHKHTSRIFSDVNTFIRAANGCRMVDLDIFSRHDENEFIGVIHNLPTKPVLQTSMVQIGFRVLELSRLKLMQIHYQAIKRLYPQAIPLSTDTDSITYFIETERDPMHSFAAANEAGDFPCFFDLAKDLVGKPEHSWALEHLTAQQRAIAWERAGELGGFGMEYLPVRIVEQIGLRAKLYSTLFSSLHKGKDSKQRAKGVMKKVMPGHSEFRESLETGLEKCVEYSQMTSRQYYMAVELKRKKALSPFNDKIYQLDEFSGRPLGHWRNCRFLSEMVWSLGAESLPFQLIMIYLKGSPDVIAPVASR